MAHLNTEERCAYPFNNGISAHALRFQSFAERMAFACVIVLLVPFVSA
jgi:hypothetical protein